MYNYEVIIYWSDDDSTFITEVPGCMADGNTRSEAIKNTERIIEEWIEAAREEGREIPTPRGRLTYA